MIYKDIEELIYLAQKSLKDWQSPDFVISVARQYEETGRLTKKQIKALENIAKPELTKKEEMKHVGSLFND